MIITDSEISVVKRVPFTVINLNSRKKFCSGCLIADTISEPVPQMKINDEITMFIMIFVFSRFVSNALTLTDLL